MQWLEITIQSSAQRLDALVDQLTAWGFDSLQIDDESDFQQFLRDNTAYWDYVDEALQNSMRGVCQVRLYLEQDDKLTERLDTLRRQLDMLRQSGNFGSLALQTQILQEQDWANNWKDNYPPLPVGQRLLIVPCWLDGVDNPENRLIVRLEPGLSFGTGAHASTQLCMRLLEQTVHAQERVIDLGCGSGILSLAALQLGAKTAVGVDIDPKAADAARANAAYNGLEKRFHALSGNVLSGGEIMHTLSANTYDIVLANIVADVIIALAPLVPQLMHPHSVFICSGIVLERAEEVQAAISAAGLQVQQQLTEDGWCAMLVKLQHA